MSVKSDHHLATLNASVSDKLAFGSLICAAMVVGIHVYDGGAVGSMMWWWNCLLHYGIFLVAVPFFFICSGYFLCRHYVNGGVADVWRVEMRNRVRSLLVPVVIWSIIGICLYQLFTVRVMANLAHGRSLFANFPDGWRFWARGVGVYPYAHPLVVPLWYVRSLLIFVVVSPILFKLMGKWGAKICIVLYFLLALLGASPETGNRVHLICSYCLSLQGLFFFSVGCALARAKEGELLRVQNFLMRRKIVLLCLCIGLGICILRTWIWQRTGWTIRHWALLFIPPLLLVFWAVVPSRPIPRWLTNAAFPIYLMHTFLWALIIKVCALLRFRLPWFMAIETLGDWWIKWAVGFGGSLGLSLALHRFLPRASGVLFGGR